MSQTLREWDTPSNQWSHQTFLTPISQTVRVRHPIESMNSPNLSDTHLSNSARARHPIHSMNPSNLSDTHLSNSHLPPISSSIFSSISPTVLRALLCLFFFFFFFFSLFFLFILYSFHSQIHIGTAHALEKGRKSVRQYDRDAMIGKWFMLPSHPKQDRKRSDQGHLSLVFVACLHFYERACPFSSCPFEAETAILVD